jgi:NAD+ kinase
MLISIDKLALNDFVIKGCNSSRTSKFYLEINGKEVCDYIADGLIISTPTGSTAYGLSAGGPVVYPTMEAVSIVPICPHTLNARPLVVPVTEVITVKTADKLLSVSIDGFETTECVEKITIKTASKKAVLAFLNKGRFYNVLRNKLQWGTSPKAY